MSSLSLELLEPSRWHGDLLICFVSAILLSLFLTPLLRHAAHRLSIVDRPDQELKEHGRPVAYMGGVALLLSFILAMAPFVPKLEPRFQAILLGAGFLLLLGLVDDLRPLSPGTKFLGQLLAAALVVKAGLIADLPLPEHAHPLIPAAITMFWIVGVTNSFNIIDVMDGLSAGVGLIALTAVFLIALTSGAAPETTILSISLAGALLGFLHFNSKPASIFLGDAGSLMLGFVLATLVLTIPFTEQNPLGIATPLLILGLPLFDTGFVMALRLRAGLPVYRGSPDHFAVRLRQVGLTERKIVLGSYLVATLLSAAAVWLPWLGFSGSIRLLGSVIASGLVAGLVLARLGSPARRDPLGSR